MIQKVSDCILRTTGIILYYIIFRSSVLPYLVMDVLSDRSDDITYVTGCIVLQVSPITMGNNKHQNILDKVH